MCDRGPRRANCSDTSGVVAHSAFTAGVTTDGNGALPPAGYLDRGVVGQTGGQRVHQRFVTRHWSWLHFQVGEEFGGELGAGAANTHVLFQPAPLQRDSSAVQCCVDHRKLVDRPVVGARVVDRQRGHGAP